MNELIYKGIVTIDGMRLHDIEGGFGPGKKAMLAKDAASIHGKELKFLNQAINNNRVRFVDGVDVIDILGTEFAVDLINSGIFTQNAVNAAKNIYVLSERGYSKLLKILEDEVAWQRYEKLLDEYFNMRQNLSVVESILNNPRELGYMLIDLAKEKERRLALEKQVEEQRPKVVFADSVSISDDVILVGDLAKILKQNGMEIGQKRLFAWLRENGYLINRKGLDWNSPTQRSMELGLFEISETIIHRAGGKVKIAKTARVTGKGQVYFVNKFLDSRLLEIT